MGQVIQFPGKKRQRNIYTAVAEQALAERKKRVELSEKEAHFLTMLVLEELQCE